jgi:hypothetical protein
MVPNLIREQIKSLAEGGDDWGVGLDRWMKAAEATRRCGSGKG